MQSKGNTGLVDESGEATAPEVKDAVSKEAPAEVKEKDPVTDENDKGMKVVGSDGKVHKVVNSATVMELRVHKLENGSEHFQLVAHEFMMVDHKPYMIRLLTEAMNTVMRAKKRQHMGKMIGKALSTKFGRFKERMLRRGK